MQEKPWWVHACQFIIWVCSIALVGMMGLYFTNTHGPSLSFGTSLFVFASLFVVGSLVVSIVFIRRLRGESGGWLGVLADIFLWW